MTLTILDPCTANRVTLSLADHPVAKSAAPAQIASRPRLSDRGQKPTVLPGAPLEPLPLTWNELSSLSRRTSRR